jgi:hypothetical protein
MIRYRGSELHCFRIADYPRLSIRSGELRVQLKKKLQCHLNHSRAYVGLHLSEGRGFNIAHRQPKIRVVEEIEKLSPELQLFGFGQVNVLEPREVPVDVTRAKHGVATLIPEYLKTSLRVWLKWLECAYVEPLLGGPRAGVWISNHVGPIAGKP